MTFEGSCSSFHFCISGSQFGLGKHRRVHAFVRHLLILSYFGTTTLEYPPLTRYLKYLYEQSFALTSVGVMARHARHRSLCARGAQKTLNKPALPSQKVVCRLSLQSHTQDEVQYSSRSFIGSRRVGKEVPELDRSYHRDCAEWRLLNPRAR